MKPDLTNDELDELDHLLSLTPEPLLPMSIVGLDGFLCGVIVQPELMEAERWLPTVFDANGTALPPDVDAQWLARARLLVMRRYEALNRSLAEEGVFDPVLYQEEPDDAAERDWLRELPASSQPLAPWVAGFAKALQTFPGLLETADPAELGPLLDRLVRHLPPDDDEEREHRQALAREQPLPTLDDAIGDLVLAVSALWDLTQKQRYRVETIRREQPKVGRNDPCPCGSGRKYKACHGKP